MNHPHINNYYPFGLKHKGYNTNIVSEHDWKYNGVELEEALDYNMYEMDFRHYDPAIGRFTSIDPVVHHYQSTFAAFDNNPIYWADPSGAYSTAEYMEDNGITDDDLITVYQAPSDSDSDSSDGGDDWIKKKGSDTYTWAENVTSKGDKDLSPDDEYIGKSTDDVKAHFKKNAGFWDTMLINFGTISAKIDYRSYNSAKMKPFMDAVSAAYKDKSFDEYMGGFVFNKVYLKDFNLIPGGFDYTFKTPDGDVKISNGYISKTLTHKNYVNSFFDWEDIRQSGYNSSKGSRYLGNYGKKGIIRFQFKDSLDYTTVKKSL